MMKLSMTKDNNNRVRIENSWLVETNLSPYLIYFRDRKGNAFRLRVIV